jgi:NhaP-type Na+/H+ or K+/H+ antiporter/mannitol/fructose-specific phosphotransferase system IIA component (Ntr-type)
MSVHAILISIALVIVLGVSAQWVAWRFRLPSILLLLLAGFVAGPVTGLLEPQALQGSWVFAFVSLSIGIILFEAGLTLRLSELREVGAAVRNLITVGVLVTWAGAGLGAYYITGFNLELSILIGALLTVTGPTVIVPLLRYVRPTGRVGTIAKWEGITIDPIGAILAVLVLEGILFAHEEAVGQAGALVHAAEGLLTVVVVGVGVSVAGVALLLLLLRRRLVPDYLQNAVALMTVVGAFALSETLQAESGLLTTTLMGIWMANQPYVSVRGLAEFKEDLQVLLLAALFIVLSARLEMGALEYMDERALLFLAVLIAVVRPLAVWVSSWGTPLEWREWAFLSWLAPRGVVAAAVASLFAFRLREIYPAEADRLAPIVFLVVVGTVAVYGLTIAPVAQALNLAQPNPQGVLVLGAHNWARQIARALDEQGVRVLMIDSNARLIRSARQEGLLAERANALSEHVIDELDLSGIGRLIALTPNDETNALAALHFAEVFESADVYQIPTRSDSAPSEETNGRSLRNDRRRRSSTPGGVGDLPRHLHGRPLFGEGVTYAALADRFEAGHALHPFRLTEEHPYEALQEHYGDDLLPLFLLREGEQVSVFSEDHAFVPQPGDTLLALVELTDEPELPFHTAAADRQRRSEEAIFEDVLEHAPVVDLEEAVPYEGVVARVAALLEKRIGVPAEKLSEQYRTGRERIVISRGAALPHVRTSAVEHPELVVVRCQSGLCIEFDEADDVETADGTPLASQPVYALFFLVSPEAHPGRHLHLLAEIASRIDEEGFQEDWCAADSEQAIKNVLVGEPVA